jgi:hypothetical protein
VDEIRAIMENGKMISVTFVRESVTVDVFQNDLKW